MEVWDALICQSPQSPLSETGVNILVTICALSLLRTTAFMRKSLSPVPCSALPSELPPSCSAEIGTAFSGTKGQKGLHVLCPACMGYLLLCKIICGCWAFPWVGRDLGAAEHGDFSIGSWGDRQGVCRGRCHLELENSTCFCGHQQDPLITPPWVSGVDAVPEHPASS